MRLLALMLLLLCGACAQERIHRGVVVASADSMELIEVEDKEPPRQRFDVYSGGELVATVEGEKQDDGTFEIFAESPFQAGDQVELRPASVKTPAADEKKDAKKKADDTKRRLLRFKIEPETPAEK